MFGPSPPPLLATGGGRIATSAVPDRRRHLHAIDVLRLVTVVGVIAVHSTSLLLPTGEAATGAVLTVLHSTREIFLTLSAVVLAHSAANRGIQARSFWRRRYPLVVAPYAVWSALYLLADPHPTSAIDLLGRYAWDLLSAGARFHLYFLLLTFQLYFIFPWVVARLRRSARVQVAMVAAGIGFQLAFTTVIHYQVHLPFPLSAWTTHPGSWLPSYTGYVVVGVVVGLHLEATLDWVRRHGQVVILAAGTAAALALGGYAADLQLLHMTPLRAGEVFQPAVVIESLTFFFALMAVGLAVADRIGASGRRRLERASEVSFGVYLAHPLLIQGLMVASGALGLNAVWSRLPADLAVALVVLVFAPALFLLTGTAVAVVLRSPLALVLAGRPAPAWSLRKKLPVWPIAATGHRRVRWAVGVPVLCLAVLAGGVVWDARGALFPTRVPDSHVAGHPRSIDRPRSAAVHRPQLKGISLRSDTVVAPVHWVTTKIHLSYGGLTRHYLVTRPAAVATGSLPVVLVLHGRDVTPTYEETRMDFQAVAGPAILVYPAGYGESWNAGLCCSTAFNDHVDDVGFLTEVVHQVLKDQPNANANGVYLAGYSNGGRMALTLDCEEPKLFAGVAVYAATASNPCGAAPQASFLMMASTGDPGLDIGPGGTPETIGTFVQPTVTAEAGVYRTADGCPTTSNAVVTGTLTETTWSPCVDGQRVALALYSGGSHGWPAGTATTPSGQAVMWAWFKQLGA
jgi:poly(3-hydroxybutyrate) depolymerase/peptidoglycan/LPS O-acetylase OafA/YrhL